MKHNDQRSFGRLATAVHTTADAVSYDKWDILTSLTDAAEVYGLNHRTLGVLKALMTFLPERLITPEHQGAVVFPSNKTLGKRLNGMPDSTLRRHLATLVSAGIVSRHDSANRKRFAKRVGQARAVAFGFDLSPLARQAAVIRGHAQDARDAQQQVSALRTQVAHLRQLVLERSGPHVATEDAMRLLRRIPVTADLLAMRDRLEDMLTQIIPTKMSATDNQNERHIQTESIILSDAENDTDVPEQISLRVVTKICKEYTSYFPDPVRHWHDLAGIADRLTPMMGIEANVFRDAIRHMGLAHATTAVLCILEQLGTIHNPGGYLRRLTQAARAGGFDGIGMLNMIASGRKLSADNL